MTATNVPRLLLCGACGLSMQLNVTARTAQCLTPDCVENTTLYELPCTSVELVPVPT